MQMPIEGVGGAPALTPFGFIDLPAHDRGGAFDHAAVHSAHHRLYVAHTANDAVDVVDTDAGQYLHSIHGLPRVAGVLVSEEQDLVFTSNRGEGVIGILQDSDAPSPMTRIAVDRRPTGLAYDPGHGMLLVANGSEPPTVSLVSAERGEEVARFVMPGRTTWAVFDPERSVFSVSVSEPARVVFIHSGGIERPMEVFAMPAQQAYGLALDPARRRLFCACDGARLIGLDADFGRVVAELPLSGVADVVLFDGPRQRLYAAIADPGVIDVFAADTLDHLQTIATEPGAHSLALDAALGRIYAILPHTNRAAVFQALQPVPAALRRPVGGRPAPREQIQLPAVPRSRWHRNGLVPAGESDSDRMDA